MTRCSRDITGFSVKASTDNVLCIAPDKPKPRCFLENDGNDHSECMNSLQRRWQGAKE